MKKLFFVLISLIDIALFSHPGHDHCSVVFVHLGPSDIPSHAIIAMQQARLFNPHCPFYFIASHASLNKIHKQLEAYHVQAVSTESLPPTRAHTLFLQTTRLDTRWANGFWRYTTERFFYLEELVVAKNLSNFFHIENDVMVYRDLNELLPTLQHRYKGIAMTFGWDRVAVAGFMYIPSLRILQDITHYIS